MPAIKQRISTEDRAEIQAEVYRLRLEGLTVRQVADRMGISKSAVSRHARAAAEEVVHPLVNEYRQMADEQMDAILQAMLPRALAGSTRHAEMAIRLLERRAKLLGLDAPVEVKQDVTMQTETDRQLAELTRSLLEQQAPQVADKFSDA